MKEIVRVVGINLLILAVYSTIIYATLDFEKKGIFPSGMLRMTIAMLSHLTICTFLLISAFMDERIPTFKAYLLSIGMILLLGFSICSVAGERMPTQTQKHAKDSSLSE